MSRVLIVEDDATIARVYHGLIRMAGAEATVAVDGELAIEALTQSCPDLVLLDLMLPKKNGVEVLKHIRATPALREIPVIVFSNACLGDLMQQAIQAGATRCLVKAHTPPKQLIEAVRSYLHPRSPTPASPLSGPPSAAPRQPDAPDSTSNSVAPARAILAGCDQELQALSRTKEDEERRLCLANLCGALKELDPAAVATGHATLSRLARAATVLITELHSRVAGLNASSVRTLAQAVDRLKALLAGGAPGTNDFGPASLVLVLADDFDDRRRLASSLNRAGLRSVRLGDPLLALEVLRENRFDLLVIDGTPPGMDRLELNQRIREGQTNLATPAVFVAPLSELESSALGLLSDGNDFLGKPFLSAELIVKALVCLSSPKSPTPSVAADPHLVRRGGEPASAAQGAEAALLTG